MPVIISSRAHEDSDGRQFGIVTFTDISEQKLAQKQLGEVNKQLSDANEKLEERQKEIEEDLALAARVQQSLAPKSIVWGGLRVETYYHPVRTIGGDFGLVSPLEEEHLNFAGVATFPATASARRWSPIAFTRKRRRSLQSASPLGDMLRQLNDFVMPQHRQLGFLFHAGGGAHRSRRTPHGVCRRRPSAGHDRDAGSRNRGCWNRAAWCSARCPDAVDDEATLDVDLDPGDRVVLYTDGITDVFNSQGEMLGVQGVQKIRARDIPAAVRRNEAGHPRSRRRVARRPASGRCLARPR